MAELNPKNPTPYHMHQAQSPQLEALHADHPNCFRSQTAELNPKNPILDHMRQAQSPHLETLHGDHSNCLQSCWLSSIRKIPVVIIRVKHDTHDGHDGDDQT